MAASCVRTVGLLLGKCRNCSPNINTATLQLYRQVLCRQICTSYVLHAKGKAHEPQGKYTPEFFQKQVEEFNIGKRHLANMMGEDPENFNQEDIDRSIAYLFPSGLFEKKARPLMKHPEEIFPKQKAVQWGADGRPFHFLFYTGKQTYYALMHETYSKILALQKNEDYLRAKGLLPTDTKQFSLGNSRWLLKDELETLLVEPISTQDYDRFIQLMQKILSMPNCGPEEEKFIMCYRKMLEAESKKKVVPPVETDENGVAFSTTEGRRKSSNSTVVLKDCGSGRITVNGKDYLFYFPVLQDREQLMFPFQFTDTLGHFNAECTVSGGGRSSQAGAVRLAISRALLSFVSEKESEAMRQAGLLTPDPRVKERKKPGQEGARRKFTWKKR